MQPISSSEEKATKLVRVTPSAARRLHKMRIPSSRTVGAPIEVLTWWATEYPEEWKAVVRRWTVAMLGVNEAAEHRSRSADRSRRASSGG